MFYTTIIRGGDSSFRDGLFRCVSQEQPNIIVILADDLGYSDLGCFGGEITTQRSTHSLKTVFGVLRCTARLDAVLRVRVC